MTQKFTDAVEAGNLISVRYSLSNELLLDPRGDSYREMKALAEERLDGLYEPLDGELPQKSAEDYTKPELMELKNDLDANFSRERLAHYEQVVAVVLREKAEQMDNESDCRKDHSDLKARQNKESDNWGTAAKYAVTVGAAAFGTAKFIVGTTATAAAGIATGAALAAGAAVKYIKDNDGEDEDI
jgi:hypothetical protein